MLTVREALAEDAALLARFAEKMFRQAFEASNSAEDMDLYCNKHFSSDMQRREIQHAGTMTLLCVEHDRLCGFAQLRGDTTLSCIESTSAVELQRLYVDVQWHGQGVAKQLMETTIAAAAAGGADALWLCVWEHNPRAIAFYRKHGFEQVGENEFHLGNDRQRDIVMLLPLGAA